MTGRWGPLLLGVCVASLAANVYLYLELKSVTPAPVPLSSLPSQPERSVAASTAAPVPQALGQPAAEPPRAPAAETHPAKSPEECTRMRLEHNRAELRDPAQRQQAKENYIASNRQEAESSGGLEALHLSDEQLNRLYELAAEWFVQSAETYPPPRNNWPLEQNPLIAAELGAEVAQKWGKYQHESSGRWRVRNLAGRMATEDVPLTADQRRQMTELFTALDDERIGEVHELGIQTPMSEAEAAVLHQGTKERSVQYRQRLLERAAPILSAQQLDILRRDFDLRTANMERGWELARSQGTLIQRDENGCVRSYVP